MSLAPDDPRHGTTNGYLNLGCRCTSCRAAQRVAVADQRARRSARLVAGDLTVNAEHGTNATYCNWGCRCSPCRGAHADARRRRAS